MAEIFNDGTDDSLSARVLVSFKAGKMNREGSTVTADPRRGRLELVLMPEDSLTHLLWRPRGLSAAPEDDLIIFPGEAEFARVRSTPDRVFVLKWRGADTRMFFWMQHTNADEDQGFVDTINMHLSGSDQSEVSS